MAKRSAPRVAAKVPVRSRGTVKKKLKVDAPPDGKSDPKRELQLFWDHLHREKGPSIAGDYVFCFKKLVILHRKSLDEMATQAYFDEVREVLQERYAAALMEFRRFRGCGFASASAAQPGTIATRGLASAAEDVLKLFDKHLEKDYAEKTRQLYCGTVRRLSQKDGESLDTIASENFVQELQRQAKSRHMCAAVRAFSRFHGSDLARPCLENASGLSTTGRLSKKGIKKERLSQMREAFKKRIKKEPDAAAEGESSIGAAPRHVSAVQQPPTEATVKRSTPRVAARVVARSRRTVKKQLFAPPGGSSDQEHGSELFLDHLRREKRPTTARLYGYVFKKLMHLHPKSLDYMATQAYFDEVREMNLRAQYLTVLHAFRRFRGCELVSAAQPVTVVARGLISQDEEITSFDKHLEKEYVETTRLIYCNAIRRLCKDGKSLDTIASKNFRLELQRHHASNNIRAAVMAFSRFRGGDFARARRVVNTSTLSQIRESVKKSITKRAKAFAKTKVTPPMRAQPKRAKAFANPSQSRRASRSERRHLQIRESVKKSIAKRAPSVTTAARSSTYAVVIRGFPFAMWAKKLVEYAGSACGPRIPQHHAVTYDALDNTRFAKVKFESIAAAMAFLDDVMTRRLEVTIASQVCELTAHWASEVCPTVDSPDSIASI